MEINFGKWALTKNERYGKSSDDLDIVWREKDVINGHILLAGASGTGKTYNIRNIIRSLVSSADHNLRIHVFDVHDDINIEGASSVLFSESSDVGLNPLKIDPNPHTGGVRKAIQHFTNTLNKTSRQLGDRQEAVLRAVLEDLYAANGFYADQPESWKLHDRVERNFPKKFPNIDDLYRWTSFKYRQMFIGGDSYSSAALDRVNKEAAKIQKFAKESLTADSENKLDKLKMQAIEAYTTYITTLQSGRELNEILKFDSKTTLKSVLDRVDNLRNSGIFRSTEPNFDEQNPIWRYRIKHLGSEEKKMFVHFKLKELYDNALKRGEQDRIVEVIVIDESNMFMDSDPDNIISIMANEIRKFGTALICASQAFTHFSDDFLASTATKIVLGIDELFYQKTARQLNLKVEWLDWIKPKRSALISIKQDVPPNSPKTGVKWFPTALR